MSQRRRISLSLLDRRILNRLQDDIPFAQRPWEEIARQLRVKEGLLLKRVAFLKKTGIVRRISAVFTPRKVNFISTLVAVKTQAGAISKVAKKINSYPEVTHNYKRGAEYNLWFTLVARNNKRIAQIKNQIKKDKDVQRLLDLPALKLFKINVKLTV